MSEVHTHVWRAWSAQRCSFPLQLSKMVGGGASLFLYNCWAVESASREQWVGQRPTRGSQNPHFPACLGPCVPLLPPPSKAVLAGNDISQGICVRWNCKAAFTSWKRPQWEQILIKGYCCSRKLKVEHIPSLASTQPPHKWRGKPSAWAIRSSSLWWLEEKQVK